MVEEHGHTVKHGLNMNVHQLVHSDKNTELYLSYFSNSKKFFIDNYVDDHKKNGLILY